MGDATHIEGDEIHERVSDVNCQPLSHGDSYRGTGVAAGPSPMA